MSTGILVFIFALEFGITPDYTVTELMEQSSYRGYTELTAGFELMNLIYFKTSVRTNVEYTDCQYLFAPYQADYSLEFGLRPWEWLELGFRHYCFHPIISGWDITKDATNQDVEMKEEIYIKLSGRVTLF